MRTITQLQIIGEGKSTTGLLAATKGINVSDVRHIIVYIVGDGTAASTVKAKGSIADEKPDFSAAQSRSNKWDYVQMKDLSDGSTVNGSTGVVFAADGIRQLEINVNGLSWLDFDITAISGGAVSVYYKGFSEN